jgi:hypothetical protein
MNSSTSLFGDLAVTKREFTLMGAATFVTAAACSRAAGAPSDAVTPEMFGARGDGRTNDTRAFAALSAHVNGRGGGTIVLRPVTYIVGSQRPAAPGKRGSFEGDDIINLSGCTGPIVIQGNGARLRSTPGLRYGRFDRSGRMRLPDAVKLDQTGQAVPYIAMINIENCSGSVEVSNVELDGNLSSMVVGGKSFRGGWEAFGYGLRLVDNSGPETISQVVSHHQPLDGLLISPSPARTGASRVTDVICDSNGRQGCTVGGGRNIAFTRCKFTRTGRAGFAAAPGAGVDIETGKDPIRAVTFSGCEFSDNFGFGLDAGTGDSAGITFTSCKFIGTTNYAAWPDRPQMRFNSCIFVGAINHLYGADDPARAAQFYDCTFTDDPSLSPTGQAFVPPGNWIAVVLQRPNVLFSGCRFRLVGRAVLPLSGAGVIYSNCTMVQASPGPSAPRGTYLGTNSIVGNAHLAGSNIRGAVTLNGRSLPVS